MSSTHSPSLLRGFSHLLAALFSNVSVFHRDWNNYRAVASPPKDIQGRWQGEWVSDVNGHHGRLKGIMVKLDPGRYEASFHATYSKVLRVCYSVNLSGREEDGRVILEGEADLGKLAGGVYHYTAEVTHWEFNCKYRCKYDHGKFHMNRLD